MSALTDEIEQALLKVLRDELPRLLKEQKAADSTAEAKGLLNVDEAARRLGISPSQVYKLASALKLPSVKLETGLRFKPEDLESYIDGCRRSRDDVVRLAHRSRADRRLHEPND